VIARLIHYTLAVVLSVLVIPSVGAVDGMALELGHGNDADAVRVSAQWNWERKWFTEGDWYLTGHWEVGIGYWDADKGSTGNANITELGVIPVFRLLPHQPMASGVMPYLEGAIGFHLLSESKIENKDMSTSFQFGDHVGFGLLFGPKRQYEVGYRLKHLSNAGIEKPNPGINFHIIRFAHRF